MRRPLIILTLSRGSLVGLFRSGFSSLVVVVLGLKELSTQIHQQTTDGITKEVG